ncbi:VUT family protein [Hyphomonas sp. NPDC076900]|uniref:VUT family protein n=2 Tax=unclassified Hyphomonas TaxID=2630699 RepID=UPI003CFDD7D8
MSELVSVLTNGQPQLIGPALGALLLTFCAIWFLNGRFWAFIYVALIPFLNWSFSVIPQAEIIAPGGDYAPGVALHPMTMVTGMVFVIRDFVQREMGHKVLILMAIAVAWSFFYSWPVIALASGIAFAVSEFVDWMVYTFTKYRLSTRILISSALASPMDTTVFLYGADIAQQMQLGAEPGNMLHPIN